MYKTAVVVPAAFSLPAGDAGQFVRGAVRLLDDAVRHMGVLLVDADGDITAGIADALDSWPSEHEEARRAAQSRLKSLRERSRVIEVSSAPDHQCEFSGCGKAASIASAEAPDLAIAPPGCPQSAVRVSKEGGTLNWYIQNRAELLDDPRVAAVCAGQKTTQEFEADIWSQVFRFARDVKLVDRYALGHAIDRMHKSANGAPPYILREWRDSLLWLVDSYARFRRTGRTGTITLVSAGDLPAGGWQRRDLISEFEALRLELAQRARVPVHFSVREDPRAGSRIPHGRYLVVDGDVLLVERGFDLLTTTRVKDVAFGWVRERDVAQLLQEIDQAREVWASA